MQSQVSKSSKSSKKPVSKSTASKKSKPSIASAVKEKAQGTAPVVQLTNHIAFVIDRSGSMGHLRENVVKAFNQNLQNIKAEVYKNTTADGKSDQKTTLSSVFFDNYVEKRNVAVEVEKIGSMKVDDYRPSGGTALLDAVGETISALETLPDANQKDTSFLVITITDGEENSSSERWKRQLTEKMRQCQASDRWSFVFLVPDEKDKKNLVNLYGIPEGNVSVWQATAEGTTKASESITRGISSYYGSRRAGEKSVKGFFKADLSNVKKKDLKDLVDLSGEAHVLKVKTECEIRPFCEEEIGSYLKGAAFYELSKDEKVQAYKKIAIKERNGKKIYGGDDARQLLGLPNADVKLRIENLANYQVFVQSTSVNRKLVRGTSLLYIPSLA